MVFDPAGMAAAMRAGIYEFCGGLPVTTPEALQKYLTSLEDLDFGHGVKKYTRKRSTTPEESLEGGTPSVYDPSLYGFLQRTVGNVTAYHYSTALSDWREVIRKYQTVVTLLAGMDVEFPPELEDPTGWKLLWMGVRPFQTCVDDYEKQVTALQEKLDRRKLTHDSTVGLSLAWTHKRYYVLHQTRLLRLQHSFQEELRFNESMHNEKLDDIKKALSKAKLISAADALWCAEVLKVLSKWELEHPFESFPTQDMQYYDGLTAGELIHTQKWTPPKSFRPDPSTIPRGEGKKKKTRRYRKKGKDNGGDEGHVGNGDDKQDLEEVTAAGSARV